MIAEEMMGNVKGERGKDERDRKKLRVVLRRTFQVRDENDALVVSRNKKPHRLVTERARTFF